MGEATYRDTPYELRLEASANQESGDVILLANGEAGVVAGLKDVASGDWMTVCTRGQFEVPAGSALTFDAGDQLKWDDTAKAVVTGTGNGDFDLGYAVYAKTSGQTTCRVNLNQAGNAVA